MTTQKRKPLLSQAWSVLLCREQMIKATDFHARAELRAAEAVIRAVSRWRRDPYATGFATVAHALDRLDKLTRRMP